MPQLIPAIIAAVAAAAEIITIAQAVMMIAMTVVSTLVGMAMKPRTSNGFATEAQGRTQIVRSNVQPRNIIYGRAMTSGPLIFAGSADGEGKTNLYMHLVIALADHECDAVEEIYLGTDALGPLDASGNVTSGRFLRTWGTPGFYEQALNNQTSVTLNTGNTIRRIVSVTASNAPAGAFSRDELNYELFYQTISNWTINGSTVTVRDIPAWATRIAVSYEIQNAESFVRAKIHLGADWQAADGDLAREISGWTQQHCLQGVCYIYLRLKYNPDVFPNGLPNVKARVRGKKILDLRTGVTAWTDNWALCIYDYLRDTRGFGCADSDIDLQSVITAANVSDEAVQLWAPLIWDKRYRCNGIVMTDKSPRDNLAEMITAGAGAVTISGGAFRVFAGAYDIPSVTLTESDLRGPVKMRPRHSRRDLFNRVKGTFVNPANNWQPSDFPAVANAWYASQDGEVIDRDIELPFTTDSDQAQRLAKIILERSRQGIVVEFPAKLTAFQLGAYSTVMVSLAKFGWDKKVFRVMEWKMSENGGVDLVLNEEAASVYDWNYGEATTIDTAPDTNLPNPFNVPELQQITLDSGDAHLIINGAGRVTSRILATWPAVTDPSIANLGKIEIQYSRVDVGGWTGGGTIPADETSIYISDVVDGMPYVVRGRVISTLGVRSDWTYSDVHTVIGKLAPPADITGLSLTALNGMAHLEWDPAINVDVRVGGRARIRHTTNITEPMWGGAIDIGGFISGAANSAQLPLLAGTYLAKWVDSSENESINAKMVITTAPLLTGFNSVAVIAEDPGFAGQKSLIEFDASIGGIKIAGDSPSGGVVDTTGLVDLSGSIARAGLYNFFNSLDLGSVQKSRVTARIDATPYDSGDYIDNRMEPIDRWEMMDGGVIDDASVELYVRTTNDNPAASPTWTAWQRFVIGDYEARAFEWALLLYSESIDHNIVVTGASVAVDMPDRRESGIVVSSAGATRVAFSKAFRVIPVIGITAQNMTQGDYFVVNSKSTADFYVTFYNAANAAVSRKFDWQAIAY